MSNDNTPSPIPAFGLGTFRLKGQVVIDSVKTGLELGYRTIDTAQIYGNEAEVGQAIAESGVARGELFVTTKIWTDNYAKDKLVPSLKESLAKLRTDHVDLTLIHWPSPGNAVPVAEFMGALAEAKAQGLTKRIGVSNFNIALMKKRSRPWARRRSPPTRSSCTPTCRTARWRSSRRARASTSPHT